ncbi:MAG: PaaI family thioesterase [Vicinamibacteria bacterium]
MLGIEILDPGPDPARAQLEVTPAVCQPFGIVHGGTLASLAETLCSVATYEAVKDDGMLALGQSNDTTFLRPISAGVVHAEARPRHRGRTSWVWDAEISDDAGRVCCLVRMTVAIRPPPSGARSG